MELEQVVANKKIWYCWECGNTVQAKEYPSFPEWSDEHKCSFEELKQ